MVNRFLTLWRPHTAGFVVGGALIVIASAGIAFAATTFQPRTEVRLESGMFNARIADTSTSRTEGLSGVEKLKPNEGLLMVFDYPDKWPIWMKGMKVPIDILWLNADKQVIHIVKNASPELGTSKSFSPTKPALYVLELPASTVDTYGIRVGEAAIFTLESGV